MKSQSLWIVGAALLAGLVASLPGDANAVKANANQVIKAVVNGRRFKAKNKHVHVVLTVGDAKVIVFGGDTPARPHPGQIQRVLEITCTIILGGVFPAPPQSCSIGYTELKVSRHPAPKGWFGPDATVTFTSFDATGAMGTFEGTLNPVVGATAPITVTKGTFDVLAH